MKNFKQKKESSNRSLSFLINLLIFNFINLKSGISQVIREWSAVLETWYTPAQINLRKSKNTIIISLLVITCFFITGCPCSRSNLKEAAEGTVVSINKMSPECGTGGTHITIMNDPYHYPASGGALSEVLKGPTEIRKPPEPSEIFCKMTVTSIIVDEVSLAPGTWTYTSDKDNASLTFEAPEHDEENDVPIVVTFRAECCCLEKLDKCESDEKTATFYFDYVAAPIVHDADPSTDCEPNNTSPWDGCPGDIVTILGENFTSTDVDEDGDIDFPVVKFNNVVAVVTDATANSIEVIVPPGPEGVCVTVEVINHTECDSWVSCVVCGHFYYKQGCKTIEPPFGTADPETGTNYVDMGDVWDDGVAGNNDVVTAGYGTTLRGLVNIFRGDGTGALTLVNSLELPAGHPTAIALGKFDDNDFADAAITINDPSGVIIFFNSGKGFELSNSFYYFTGNDPNDIVVADFENDGRSDLVVSNGGDYNLTILNASTKSVGAFDLFPVELNTRSAHPLKISAGNFDGENGSDVAVVLDNNKVELHLIDLDEYDKRKLGVSISMPPGFASAVDLKAGNYFGHTTSDVAVLYEGPTSTTNGIVIYEYDATAGTFETGRETPLTCTDPSVLTMGDFNDGNPGDFAVGNSNGTVEIVYMSGSSIIRPTELITIDPHLHIIDMVSGHLNTSNGTMGQDLVMTFEERMLVKILNEGGGF